MILSPLLVASLIFNNKDLDEVFHDLGFNFVIAAASCIKLHGYILIDAECPRDFQSFINFS